MSMFRNRYAGRCNTCNCTIKINEGWCRKESGQYKAYCEEHAPEAKPKVKKQDRRLTADGRCVTPYEPANLDLFRALPGARFVAAKEGGPHWNFSLDPGDRRRVLEIGERLKLEIAPELLAQEATHESIVAEDSGLYPFQVEGVDWMALRDDALLGDDMGLGKTVQTLMALPRKECFGLAIVPGGVKYNWANECKIWRPDLTPVVIEGKKNFRLPAKGELVIANYELLPAWLAPVEIDPKAKPRREWDVKVEVPTVAMRDHMEKVKVIIDEAQYVKNYKTLRAQRVNGLSRLVKSMWGLTGTPLTNRPQDLYGVLSALGMAHKVFGGWNRFVKVMNGKSDGWGGYSWGTPTPIVPELLRRVMLRRMREDVLPDLPKKTYTETVVPLPKKLQRRCDQMWAEWGEYLIGELGEAPKNAQLPPFEEFSSLRAELAASRIPALAERVEEHEEDEVPLMVFCAHLAPLEELGKRDGWGLITGATPAAKRTEIVKQFQAGKLKGIAASIKAGGVGITTTRAWKAIFVDLDWVPGWNKQAEDRICRIGQESKTCEIERFVSEHILDRHVLALLTWKSGISDAAVDDEVEVSIPKEVIESAAESAEDYEARMNAERVESKTHEWSNSIPQDELIPF